jgi:hypothetical protein
MPSILPSRGGSPALPPGPPAPPGICGPDVTVQFAATLRQIQSDFRMWTRDQRESACTRILFPVKMPTYTPGMDPKAFLISAADINGWDTMPLFQGASDWLRSARVLACPCATPSSPKPGAPPFDDAHEDPSTCSNSVQVAGECWLNGTVNYGTFGLMVRLCKDEFPIQFAFAQQIAEGLMRAYKSLGPHPEDVTLPLAWFRATFFGGPAGVPTAKGNRPQCACRCSLDGSIVDWDYVWEPVKPRTSAKAPTIKAGPSPPPKPPLGTPPTPLPSTSGPTAGGGSGAGAKTHTVAPGDSLSKLAQKYYGDMMQWPKIYAANQAVIGPNPNLIKPGQKLVIPK